MMKLRNWVWVLSAAAVLCSSGCMSRAIKEGVGVATGAKGSFAESPSMGAQGARPLAGYRDFQVGRVEDDFKGRTPRELLRNLPRDIRETLTKEKLPSGKGGRTCVINVTIRYYEHAGSMGQVFGPLEEVVAEVQLVDKADDRVVGTAMCVGRSTTTANQGVEKKSQGLAKGIVNWIKSRYPETK
ncbi:MAG: hypothetical protein JXA11_17095 [Phycisphaerae bacterium]|nr:hypothetical protein [Phycisphaerae bacterium]